MFDFHDPGTQAMIQSFVALVTAATTIALTLLTARYVRLTGAILEETRISRGPNIFVDLEISTREEVKLVIGNSGLSPAHNITFHVTDSIPWRNINGSCGFNSMDVIQNGISYIAPGRTLKYEAGFRDYRLMQGKDCSAQFRINYQDSANVSREMSFKLDMSQYASVLYESFTNPESEIAKAIEKSQDTPFGTIGKSRWLMGKE